MPSPIVRTMSFADVEVLLNWADAEGWNPGLGDAPAFHSADPDGFIGAFVNDELVAGISAVAYGKSYGFIGLYICRPDMRGRGYGKLVWNAGISRLAGRTIGLDGVDAQFENYRSKGFEKAYRTVRYGGMIEPPAREPAGKTAEATADMFPEIVKFDTDVFGAVRDTFLAPWLAPPHKVLVVRDGLAITGYAVMRKCQEGYKVGPLFARDNAIAISLFTDLAGSTDQNVFLDAPATNTAFSAKLTAIRLVPGFETTRMYRGGAQKLNSAVFGITSLELG